MISKKKSLFLLIVSTLFIFLVFYFLKPIPQQMSYHHFADQRSLKTIPYALNVLSNIAIGLPGIFGLFLLQRPKSIQFNDAKEKWLWLGFSIGLILTAIGSAYYHLAPDNYRLIFDRLPMTFVFMTLVSALIGERINIFLGVVLWPILVLLGFYTVLLWYMSEMQASSDLRFYLNVQVFAILTTFIMWLSYSPYNRNFSLAIVIMCYLTALLFDHFDHEVYQITNTIISGHTLKHLMIGVAGALIIEMLWKRKGEKPL